MAYRMIFNINKKFKIHLLIGTLASFQLLLSAAEPDKEAPETAVQVCRHITSSLGRLRCYDRHFPPPLKLVRKNLTKPEPVKNWNTSEHKQVSFLRRYIAEAKLFKQPSDLQMTEHKGGDARIIISTVALIPASSNAPADSQRAVLFFQCYQDISSMQLLWPTDLDTGKADVRIWSGGKLIIDSSWRAMDEAFLLSSPYGLPSIRMIKRLFDHSRIQIQVTVNQQRYNATFNIDKLNQVIKPLAEQCSWL